MKTTMRGFGKRMQVRATGVERNADNMVKLVTLAVDQAVVLATPVDTGRARANWRASLGAPLLEQLPEPPAPGAGASQALQEGEAVASKYRGGRPDSVVHLTNSLPYIGRLNDGWSKQAPANFVAVAVATAVRVLKRVKIVATR